MFVVGTSSILIYTIFVFCTKHYYYHYTSDNKTSLFNDYFYKTTYLIVFYLLYKSYIFLSMLVYGLHNIY